MFSATFCDVRDRAHAQQTAPGVQSGAPVAASLTNLKTALAMGPNGPIPAIVIDQFGYLPTSRKVAVIRDPAIGYDNAARFTPSAIVSLVDVATGTVTKSGPPVLWNGGAIDPASGDRAWWFDFSDITKTGRYAVVDFEKGIRSPEFAIAEDVYRKVLRRAVKMLYYQRAGIRKTVQHAGASWADAASHSGPGQDAETLPWPGALAAFGPAKPGERDLRGGWYDAGDYNKYTTWTARNTLVLLSAYRDNPRAFDDETGIPESQNGVPDLLDEIKWSLDWLARMQGPDGAVLCVQRLSSATPPSAARGPSHYGPPTTSATLMSAATFAYASRIYAKLDRPGFAEYSEELARRAQSAWKWAAEHPTVVYWNNDEERQPGSKGLAHGQQELNEGERALAKFEAALYLYEVTREPALKAYLEANYRTLIPAHEPLMWHVDTHEALLRLSRAEGIASAVGEDVRSWFLGHAAPWANAFAKSIERADPYRAPISQYTWASNKAKALQARLFQLVAAYSDDGSARAAGHAAAREYAHYIHGVNPLGLVYLTNMREDGATHSASTMFHAWFAKGTRWERVTVGKPGPPPGYLVGGPNPSFGLDACCEQTGRPGTMLCHGAAADAICKQSYRPPIGQPPAKSYLQFNDGWPANSWSITEPSTAYQVYYIRLLAAFVG